MILHSKFLIHWTGRKDINPKRQGMDDDLRQKYIDRLRDTCEKGLFMKPGNETIYGRGESRITAGISRVCFSEIRLSQVKEHANRYGDLGIGFSREFIIEREGNPVFYVQNGDKGAIIGNFATLHKHHEESGKLLVELELILGYLKQLSDKNDTELKYYDEMEWRLVHINRLEGSYITVEDKQNHIYRWNLVPKDIKIIVFPDSETQILALRDRLISEFFKDYVPMLVRIDECENF